MSVHKFSNKITELMRNIMTASQAVDEKLAVQSELVNQMLVVYLRYMKMATRVEVKVLVTALEKHTARVHDFRNQYRNDKLFNYFSAFVEAAHIFYWHRSSDPNNYVIFTMNSVRNYTDKIFKEGANPNQVEWVKEMKAFLLEFKVYVDDTVRLLPLKPKATPRAIANIGIMSETILSLGLTPALQHPERTWYVESKKNEEMTVENADIITTVVIRNCENTSLKIINKPAAVAMEKCISCCLMLHDVRRDVRFVDCVDVTMQVNGEVGSVFVINTKGCKMYLNDSSLNVEVISRNSTDMSFMVRNHTGDFVEYRVENTLKTVFVKGRGAVTEVVPNVN